jgi:hypothetical protein
MSTTTSVHAVCLCLQAVYLSTCVGLGQVGRGLLAGLLRERMQIGLLRSGHRLIAGDPVRRVLLRLRDDLAGAAGAGVAHLCGLLVRYEQVFD